MIGQQHIYVSVAVTITQENNVENITSNEREFYLTGQTGTRSNIS